MSQPDRHAVGRPSLCEFISDEMCPIFEGAQFILSCWLAAYNNAVLIKIMCCAFRCMLSLAVERSHVVVRHFDAVRPWTLADRFKTDLAAVMGGPVSRWGTMGPGPQ